MREKFADFVLRTVNRMMRVRDSVYLDTNAWSSLAKGNISPDPVKAWVRERGYHFWMARFQLAELSRDTRLSVPLAQLLKDMPVVVLDYGQNDFKARPWHKVEIAYQEWIHLNTDELFREFVHQLCEGPIHAASTTLRKDAEIFGISLDAALAAIPAGTLSTPLARRGLENDSAPFGRFRRPTGHTAPDVWKREGGLGVYHCEKGRR